MIHKYEKKHSSLGLYLNAGVCTYYLQLKVVSETRRAVNPQQSGVFLLCAEPQGQAVCSGAGTLIRGPRVNHHASITAKDISGPSCPTRIIMFICTHVDMPYTVLSGIRLYCRWHLCFFSAKCLIHK